MCLFYFLKVVKKIEDPSLINVALMIPSILLKSRADSTVKTYHNSFEQWSKWAHNHEGVQAIPADPLYVAIYLTSLIQQNNSYNKIKNIFYAISWFHKISSQDDPCKNNTVKCLLEASKRILSKPKVKKLPLTPYHLIQIVRKHDDQNCLKQLRLVTMFLIGFSGFLRYQELANIRKGDIIFYKHFMRIFIEKSKCDQYRTGKWVFIARTDNITCPVRSLKKYVKKIKASKYEFIFRGLTYFKSRNSYKLKKKNTPICYSSARDIILNAIEEIGVNKRFFGTHSLRSGGATAAANFGVSDRLFKQHGRWSSEKAKDGYVQSNLSELLSVTKNLGI